MEKYIPPNSGAVPIGMLVHGGVELPVYKTGDAVWNPWQLEQAAAAGRSDIVRFARVASSLGRFTLGPFLRDVDAFFEQVADECDAEVIAHTWGLAKTHPDVYQIYSGEPRYEHEDLPPGMSIVMQVPILPDLRDISYSPNYPKIRRVTDQLFYNPSGRLHWVDARYSAFGITEGRTVLFDAEPMVRIIEE